MTSPSRTVCITGAAGNLGKAVAAAFATEGARLVLIDLKLEGLQSAFEGLSGERLLLPTNLLDAAAVQASIAKALDQYGRIDVLCNVAGGFTMGAPVHETTDQTWDQMFDLNDRTLLNMVRAVVPAMLKQGSGKIVNVAAFNALRGAPLMAAYSASKSGVIRLTEAMAAELRERNINVNCVLPTIIDTPQNRAAMPGADHSKWVPAADLANVIAFLASDAARAVHGAALPVTGLS